MTPRCLIDDLMTFAGQCSGSTVIRACGAPYVLSNPSESQGPGSEVRKLRMIIPFVPSQEGRSALTYIPMSQRDQRSIHLACLGSTCPNTYQVRMIPVSSLKTWLAHVLNAGMEEGSPQIFLSRDVAILLFTLAFI